MFNCDAGLRVGKGCTTFLYVNSHEGSKLKLIYRSSWVSLRRFDNTAKHERYYSRPPLAHCSTLHITSRPSYRVHWDCSLPFSCIDSGRVGAYTHAWTDWWIRPSRSQYEERQVQISPNHKLISRCELHLHWGRALDDIVMYFCGST